MRLAVVIIVLLFVCNLSYGQRRRNRKRKGGLTCHLKDVEKCLDTVSSLGKGDNPTVIITTSQGLDKFCGAVRNKFANCVRDYFKKCGTPLHREVMGLVMDQVLSHATDLCTKGAKREKFLKSSPCLHEKVLSQKTAKEECNNRYISSLNRASSKQNNNTLNGVCCGYIFWEDCTQKLVKAECGDAGVEAFQFFLSHGFMDIPTLTCPKDVFLLESSECKAAIAPKGKKVKLNLGDNGVGKYNVANVFSWMFQV